MRVQCPCAGTSREVVTLCSDFSVPSSAGCRVMDRSWLWSRGRRVLQVSAREGKRGKGKEPGASKSEVHLPYRHLY